MRWSSLAAAVFGAAVGAVVGVGAAGAETSSVPGGGCIPCLSGAASTFTRELAEAPDVEAARARALGPVRIAHDVVERALWLAPGSDDLRQADVALERFEEDVLRAETPEAVARRYERLLAFDRATLGSTSGLFDGCVYSTGEIIAIVIGFLLGIIPGIILLFVLC